MAASRLVLELKYKFRQVPLPDGDFDWLAVLLVHVSGGSRISPTFEALIDSGATYCLFHGDVARAIGILDITSGKRSAVGGVVQGPSMILYAHEIRLHIGPDNFKIEAHFSDQLPVACLLGRKGFFDKYIVTFDPTETSPGFELTRVHRS